MHLFKGSQQLPRLKVLVLLNGLFVIQGTSASIETTAYRIQKHALDYLVHKHIFVRTNLVHLSWIWNVHI